MRRQATNPRVGSGRGLKRFGLAVVLVLLTVPAEMAWSQRVDVQRPFFRGWRYSLDSAEFRRLGSSAEDLRSVMKDYRVCISALNSYRSHATAAKITGLTSGFLIAIPMISVIRGKEWTEGYTPMMIVALSMAGVSIALEAAGSRSLKKAVRLYNRYAGYSGSDPPEPAEYWTRSSVRGFSVTFWL